MTKDDPIRSAGHLPDGREVQAITLAQGDLQATVLTLGAVLQDLRLAGVDYGLTLGSPDPAAYLGPLAHFGAVIGPVANRIKGAQAVIEGQDCRFDDNIGGATLHSGSAGTQWKLWQIAGHGPDHVTLTLDLPDGEGGFPGNRRISARYAIIAPAILSLTIEAETDRISPVSFAHHGYWNMDGSADWGGHSLQILADHYLPMSAENLPTGEVSPVTGTRFDYRAPIRLLPEATGRIDHNFCLATTRRELTPALRLVGRSGVTLEIATTEPGIQVFDMAPLTSGDAPTVHDRPYGNRAGLAFEPQLWPGALHDPAFPSLLLSPGESYRQETHFSFSRPEDSPA